MFIRLYYTKRCNECLNLLRVIQNEGIERMFIYMCLDEFSAADISKLSIKVLPSIVVSIENQNPSVYEGPQRCSQWLTDFTINRRRNLAQQVEQQMRMIQKTHATIRQQEGGPIEYTEAEMDGIGDSYAYNNIDICQPKNFVIVGTEDKSFIRTPNMEEGKVNLTELERRLDAIEKSRNNDRDQFMKNMEQNQINAIFNNQNQF